MIILLLLSQKNRITYILFIFISLFFIFYETAFTETHSKTDRQARQTDG